MPDPNLAAALLDQAAEMLPSAEEAADLYRLQAARLAAGDVPSVVAWLQSEIDAIEAMIRDIRAELPPAAPEPELGELDQAAPELD